jgi:hypothetical protein
MSEGVTSGAANSVLRPPETVSYFVFSVNHDPVTPQLGGVLDFG